MLRIVSVFILGLLIVAPAEICLANEQTECLVVLVKTIEQQYTAGDEGLSFSVKLINRTDTILSLPAYLHQHEDKSTYLWPAMSFSLIKIFDDGRRESIVSGYGANLTPTAYINDTVHILPHDSIASIFKYYDIGVGGPNGDRKEYITPARYIIDASCGIGDASNWISLKGESNQFEIKPVKPIAYVQFHRGLLSLYLWVNKRCGQYELFFTNTWNNDSLFIQNMLNDTLNQKVYTSQRILTSKDMIEPLDVCFKESEGNCVMFLWNHPIEKKTILRSSNFGNNTDFIDIMLDIYLKASMKPKIDATGDSLMIKYYNDKNNKESVMGIKINNQSKY